MLLLFPFFVYAENMASEKYCFSSLSGVQLAQKKFSAIQVNSDVATIDDNCLVIQMRPHRRELIQRYILSAAPGATIVFSSAEVRRDPCKLKVEKIKNEKSDQLAVDVSNQFAEATKTEVKGSGSEVMQIDTLNEFRLSYNENEILGNCRYITSDRYEIKIEVRKNPKPVVPVNLPPGTIAVINTPPPDQKTMVLQTELQLTRGERIEVGDLIRKTNNKEQSVSINPSLTIENVEQNASEKVFLSLQ